MRGYYTYYSYMGWTGNGYQPFATKEEYQEWYEENLGF